jgi:hypothetical protein
MAANTRTASRSDLSALRRGAMIAYRWLVLGFLLAGGIQIFLAGLGVFSFRDQDAAAGSSAYDAHQTLGFTMGGIAVVILIAALIARPGVLPTCLAAVLVLQTCLVQSLLASLADNTALYGGLHALDGLLALGIAGLLYASARRWQA